MNMQQLMQQAQKMQKDIAKKKEEIDATVFESKSGIVTIKVNGKKEMISLIIESEKLEKDDIEMLEDMVKVAFNDCIKQIEKVTKEKLGQYASAMDGLM